MNCKEFETAFEAAIERRSTLESTFVQHIGTCLNCRTVWQRQQSLDAAIAAWKEIQPPVGLDDAVLADLARSPNLTDLDCLAPLTSSDELSDLRQLGYAQPPRPVRLAQTRNQTGFGGLLVVASSVACVVVIVTFAQMFSRTPLGRELEDMANFNRIRSDQIAGTNLPRDYSKAMTEVMSEFKTEYDDFATETSAAVFAIADAMSPRSDAAVTQADGNSDLVPQASDAVKIWQPFGSRVKTAFGFLRLALPSQGPSS